MRPPGCHSRNVFSNPNLVAQFPTWRVRALAGLILLGVAGCATGDISMVATIAGGEKIRVPIGPNGAVLTREGGVQINTFSFTLNPEKKFVYVFEFTVERNRPLRHVRVEDVSDESAVTLIDRADPTLSAAGRWRGESEPLSTGNGRLKWLATISNSLRVVRFTLTFADGKTQVLHQGTLFPAGLKSTARQAMGQNY
jgi:hypothetical protein